MDFLEAEETFVPVDVQETFHNSDNFQKFMYELFDKNGIINDLRAYLRGHIVNILKNAETGNLSACQKHLTQRLELPFQAFNILIVEYMLTMEFNYTLSVFISEIPLANMVFEFTKALLNSDTEAKMSNLRFEDGDVWSILNYIGLQCSSEHAMKIVELYKREKQPLLMCILKCLTIYQKEEEHNSDQSSITQSSETLGDRTWGCHRNISKCRHFMVCEACQYRVARMKEKYKRKKARIQKQKGSSIKKLSVETFMNNMSVLERTLIEEMFQQLKTVYEAEVETVKEEQQKKVKQFIASHALQLQKHRDKMEASFKAREEELSQAIQQKKRFLWGLARSLRDQHEHLTRAMTEVRQQTKRLTQKESSLKTQLEEAEQMLKKRGEDMRNQISEELVILEGHLESLKNERDRINEERKEIENLKNIDTNIPTEKDLKPQYDFLKTELTILREYIEATKLEPKCVIERGTITDFGIKCFMNNENIGIKMEKQQNNRVINDLKKPNNFNFSQINLGDINNISEKPSTDSNVGDTGVMREDNTGDILDGAILDVDKGRIRDKHLRVGDIHAPGDIRGQESDVDTLRQENERLKNFARQQREHIQALFNEKDRLQQALTEQSRPRTAPVIPNYFKGHRSLPDPRATCPRGSGSSEQWGGAAGGLETRLWRIRYASGTTIPINNAEETGTNLSADDTDRRRADEMYQQNTSNKSQQPIQKSVFETNKVGQKSSKAHLRESKDKLRSNTVKQTSSDSNSDAMLREAKRRLRKLEIEAEAVEKSYQDFRKRHSELSEERENIAHVRDNLVEKVEKIDVKHPFENYEKKNTYKRNLPLSFPKESPKAIKDDFDKYFKEYAAKLNLSQLGFENKNSVIENVKPIPAPFSNKKDVNYLETPLMEFRKLYQGQRTIKNKSNIVKDVKIENKYLENIESEKVPNINKNNQNKVEHDNNINIFPQPKLDVQTNNDAIRNTMDTNSWNKSETRDTIINNNIDTKNNLENGEITPKEDNNFLMVEVEKGCDKVIVPEDQELLIIVESSVDNKDMSDDGEQICPPMTIIVSPKNKGGSKDFESPKTRSISPEIPQMDTLKPIFLTDNKELSSIDLQLDTSKENVESISDVGKNPDDYLDDFSADVDNYNSPSEYGNNSPISLPKTSEDEKFWES